MKRITSILMLVVFLFPAFAMAADSTAYTGLGVDKEYTRFERTIGSTVACVQPYNKDNETVGAKIKIFIDSYALSETITRRDCVNGLYAKDFFEDVYAHIQEDNLEVISPLGSQYPQTVIQEDFLGNMNLFNKVFTEEKYGDGVYRLGGHDYLYIQDPRVNSPLDEINDKIQYNKFGSSKIYKEDFLFYYALATENFGYRTVTETYLGDDYTYLRPNNNDFFALTDNTESSTSRAVDLYSSIATDRLDIELNDDKERAYYAFSDDLSYYYYPAYIKEVIFDISTHETVFDADAGINAKTKKRVEVDAGKESIQIPFWWSENQFDYSILAQSNFRSEVLQDVELGTFNQNNDPYVRIEVNIEFRRHPHYRHKSPVDATAVRWSDIYGTTGFMSDCGLKDVCRLRDAFTMNLSAGSDFDAPVTPIPDDSVDEENNFNETTNTTTPQPDYDDVDDNSSNVDWGTGGGNNPGTGGSLENQILYAEGKQGIIGKSSFFFSLQEIAEIILKIFVTLYSLAALVVTIFAFFIVAPSGYKKLIREFKKLSRFGS